MTSAWTAGELERIGAAEELQMAPLGADGAPRRPVPIAAMYGRYPSYVEPMVGAGAQATTLRLVPAGDEHHL